MRRHQRAHNRRSWSAPSQPFAGIGVADRKGKEGEAQRQHQNVHHGKAPRCAAISGLSPDPGRLRANAMRVSGDRPELSPR